MNENLGSERLKIKQTDSNIKRAINNRHRMMLTVTVSPMSSRQRFDRAVDCFKEEVKANNQMQNFLSPSLNKSSKRRVKKPMGNKTIKDNLINIVGDKESK